MTQSRKGVFVLNGKYQYITSLLQLKMLYKIQASKLHHVQFQKMQTIQFLTVQTLITLLIK